MISRIINKLAELKSWQLVVAGIVTSEILTLFFSVFFSYFLWGEITKETLIIGFIDTFGVASIVLFFTIFIVKRIKVTEITNKQLIAEIEERKQIESQNEELERQLQQSQKMEAVGTLAGGIAHDFNNILTAILGYSEMVKTQLPPNEKASRDLEQVIQAGHRATHLVQQILTFSRRGEEKLQPLRVQPIIQEALKLFQASLPATIQLKESITTDCGPVLADPTQMHQVLMNLCTNAKDAIDDNPGILNIALSQIEISETFSDCPQLVHGVYLDLEISDTGCGMNAVTLSKVFDPFFTTKAKDKGTGLGLAVVHGIIKQHKGEITVFSEPGRGTTFHIYLPVIKEESSTATNNIPEDIAHGNGERILFIDDEHSIVDMMRQLLEHIGYMVTTSTNSSEALDIFKNNRDQFDLIITDMTMPEMTGVDLAREIHILEPKMPIILCSGYSEIINKSNAKSFGIDTYLKKPIDKQTLAKVVKSSLQRAAISYPTAT